MVQALRLAVGVLLLFFLLAAHAQNTPTCGVAAEPATLTGGGDVTVSWTATHAVSCLASGGWSGAKDPAGGSQVLAVSQSRTFTLNCKAATGQVVARWTKVTANTDGTPATITGYRLYIADAPSGLPSATAIPLPATPLEYTFWRSPGDVSAGIRAVRSDQSRQCALERGVEERLAAAATCSDSVTVNPRPKAPSLTLTLSKLLEFFKGKPDQG